MKTAIALILATLACTAVFAEPSAPPPWDDFGFGTRETLDGLKMKAPDVVLTGAERARLADGGLVTRMMDAPGGYKIGYLRFVAPFDPVTAYMVVGDVEHYDATDPAFDSTGSVTQKRRSFWPGAFENDACVEDGRVRMNQLIVLPVMAPRKMCLAGSFDTSAFPWESHWDLAGVEDCCLRRRDPDLDKYYEKAIAVTRNKEAWHISPLPASMRKTPGDVLRADCVYIADVNPGGDLGKMDFVANMALKSTLPQLARHVIASGKEWERHLSKRYGAKAVQAYKEWVRRYREAMGAESKASAIDPE